MRKTEEKHARSLTGTGSGNELPRPAVVSSGQTIFGIADADTVRAAVSRNMVLEFRSVVSRYGRHSFHLRHPTIDARALRAVADNSRPVTPRRKLKGQ
eukprot:SAG11_NODE_552_length_8583_cov_3.699081_1_plen_98_part_00